MSAANKRNISSSSDLCTSIRIRKYSYLMVLGLFLVMLSSLGCATTTASARSNVHVQLNDGQVIVGELATSTFVLKTELGTIEFDTAEAGELGPLEGSDMKQSDNLIRLWLRNGSEFIGGWDKPSVEMKLKIGDKQVAMDVPIDKLKRLRFSGQPVYNEKQLYRVLSRSGDDFFVEADRSRVNFSGEMGTFSPYLSEIASLTRLDQEKNVWQVQLKNGSRLHASIQETGLELRPALGPEKLKLAWNQLARMEPMVMRAQAVQTRAAEQNAPAYYDNSAQRVMKEAAASSWHK